MYRCLWEQKFFCRVSTQQRWCWAYGKWMFMRYAEQFSRSAVLSTFLSAVHKGSVALWLHQFLAVVMFSNLPILMGIQWNLIVVLICICLISRNVTLPTKVCLVKAMVFPVVMHECESWTIKKAEHWRIDAFKVWWWRRLLRVPWTARRSHQSTLKEINPEYSLDGLMLKLQYFGHLMQRASSLEETLMLGKIEGRRRRGKQRMRWLDDITDSVDMNLSKQGSLTCCSPRGCRVGHDSDWTTVTNDADRLFMGGHYSTLGGMSCCLREL